MKNNFIIWTIVWWGIAIIGEQLTIWNVGGYKNYGALNQDLNQAINLFFYIFLYMKFIRDKKSVKR